MFRHLLAPLDGSHLAESVLPAVAALAGRLDARVILLHVIERGAPAAVHGERHLTRPAEAKSYLSEVVQWLTSRAVRADAVVHGNSGDVAGTIAQHAADRGAGLIVLCRHGRSGFRGLLFGRIAQQVLARGATPVLLMQPTDGGREQSFTCRRLLVPLDGSESAEVALPAATIIARACAAEVLLTWVVPTAGTISDERTAVTRLMPTATAALLDAEAVGAAAYLDRVRSGLEGDGVAAAAAVERGDTVRVLLDAAAKHNVDLIVMATHGRSGVSAVWAGSVAARIAAHSIRPILFVRVPRPEGDRSGTRT